jgi:hypothetical protein
MEDDMGMRGVRQEGSLVQGFAADPAAVGEYTVGTSDAIDVTGRVAIRWSSKDGSTLVTRVLNDNATGLTALSGVDVLDDGVTGIDFTAASGTPVVEYELM